MRRRSALCLLAAAGAMPLATSMGDAGATPTSTDPPADSVLAVERDDGVLRIGLLLPLSGEPGWIGLPASNAARYAVNIINAVGGFLGREVELVSEDEGSSTESATAAIDRLIAQGVDAVVGPASSNVALTTLDRLMNAGIVTCSPSASSLLLDDFPNRSRFFRTVPSDSLQMAAIAVLTGEAGRASAVVFYRNDQYGQGLLDAFERELGERTPVQLAAAIPLEIDDTDLTAAADQLAEHGDSTIIVLANSQQGLAMLQAIGDAVGHLGLEPDVVLVNDAVLGPPEFYLGLPAQLLPALRRIGPVAGLPQPVAPPPASTAEASTPDPAPTEAAVETAPPVVIQPSGELDFVAPAGPFALNAYDCVNLIALAANDVESDDPAAIAEAMAAVANTGRPCSGYADCAALAAEGLDFNYNGNNGQNTLYQFGPSGDLSRAALMTYRVQEDGVEVANGTVSVTEQ